MARRLRIGWRISTASSSANYIGAQRRLKQSIPSYLHQSRPLNLVAAPVIYSVIVPIALLDLWLSLYQWICFPLFGIAKVQRRDYIVVDRHRLPYLNGIEKLNCVYWCPIRHARRIRGSHARYRTFAPYGDAATYKRKLPAFRRSLRK